MSPVMLYRASGMTLLLGLLLLLISGILRMLIPFIPTPTQEASAQYLWSGVLALSGLALFLFGWLGIVARLAELTSWPGLVGALLIFLGGVVLAAIAAYDYLATPWYAVHAPYAAAQVALGTPEVGVASYVAGTLVFAGALLAELALLRARHRAAWAGVLMVLGGILALVFDFVIASALVFIAAILLFVLGLGWMAYALLSEKGNVLLTPSRLT